MVGGELVMSAGVLNRIFVFLLYFPVCLFSFWLLVPRLCQRPSGCDRHAGCSGTDNRAGASNTAKLARRRVARTSRL